MTYFVYFIQEEHKGKKHKNMPMKIGHAKDVTKRVTELQTGNPRKLLVRASIPLDTKEEAAELEVTIHYLAGKKFKRLKGEWFMIYGPMKSLIEQSWRMFEGNQKAKSIMTRKSKK